jgi:hypothetical protein
LLGSEYRIVQPILWHLRIDHLDGLDCVSRSLTICGPLGSSPAAARHTTSSAWLLRADIIFPELTASVDDDAYWDHAWSRMSCIICGLLRDTPAPLATMFTL